TGGAISYIDYVGIQTFVAECDDFQKRFGDHWAVPVSLRQLAENKQSVHNFGKATTPSREVITNMLEPELVDYARQIGLQASINDRKAETLEKVLTKLGYQ
ncbi:MAG: hypothetical protein AAGD05_19375, partial [Bacteroidota bacterium]